MKLPGWWSPLVCAVVLGGVACDRTAAPEGARVALGVSALSLSGVRDAIWDIEVLNGATPRQVVWQRRVTSSQFGDGAGSVTWVGPCDASAPDNLVRVWVVGLYAGPVATPGSFASGADSGVGATSLAFTNPTAGGPLERVFTCVENADTQVVFDVTLLRPATQGFFDIAVSFNDIFCSAKFDCCYDRNGDGCASDGAEDIRLLFDGEGKRQRTFVLAFACTAGADLSVDTELYLNALELDCDVGSGPQAFAADVIIDPTGGPTGGSTSGGAGNLCVAGEVDSCPAVTAVGAAQATSYLYQVASYVGTEALTSGNVPAQKVYWNLALGVEDGIASCRLRTRGTADDAADPNDNLVNGVVAPGAIYPYIEWDVDLSACGSFSVSGDPAAPVHVRYTTPTEGAAFSYHVGQSLVPGGFCTPACQHGGVCQDGACNCQGTGYVGDHCETPLVPPDTTPPAAPVVTSPTSPYTSAGASVNLVGTCETGALVRMNGAATGTTLCVNGAFALGFGQASDGTWVVSLAQTDAANNTSPATSFTWVRDTVAPVEPVVVTPASSESLTGEGDIVIAGTCTEGLLVELGGAATDVATCVGGGFSFGANVGDGTWVFTVRQVKPTGVASAVVTRTVTVDTTPPAAPALTSPSSPHTTAADAVTVRGTCEVGATVLLSGDQSDTSMCIDGTFAFDLVQLVNGTWAYNLRQRDLAGNVSPVRTVIVVRDDTVPEDVVITEPAGSAAITPTSPLAVRGTCSEGFIVHLTGDATDSTPCQGGVFAFQVTADADGDRVYLIHQENDLTGLVSGDVTVSWRYDTTAPAPPVVTSPGSTPHTSGGDVLAISGTCEPGAVVVLGGDEAATRPCTGGTFAFTVTRVDNGTYTFEVSQTDAAGNGSDPVEVEWTRDATIPASPVVTSHTSPELTNTSTLAIAGTCQAGFIVHLLGAEARDTTCSGGTFAFVLAQATDGSHGYQLTQENPLTGLESGVTDFVWTRDTVQPEPVVFTAPTSRPLVSGDSVVALRGTCEAGATVLLSGAGIDAVTCDGTFVFVLSQAVDGTYDYHVAQRDAAGNFSGSADFAWTRDTVIPSTPLIAQPTGASALSNAASLTISGSCEEDFTVELSGDEVGSVTCAAGAFSFVVSEAAEGSHVYSILQRSTRNGFASASTTVTWQVDRTPPPALTFTTPATSPHTTAETSQTLSGPCVAGTTVALGGSQTGSVACAGSYLFTLTQSVDGGHDYTLTATDAAGNASAATAFRWVLDRTVPSTPVVTSPSVSPHVSATTSLVLSGTCTTGFTVYLQGASTQTQTCVSGAFAFTVTADRDASYVYSLYQENPLTGLESGATSFTWVSDTTRPDEVSVTSPPSNPYFSGDDTIVIAGGCEVGATVAMTGSASGSMSCVGGAYQFSVTRTQNATYNFNLVQTDAAGNASLTYLFQWVRDNTIPATPVITSPATPYFGTSPSLSIVGTCITNYTVYLSGAGSQSQTCTNGAFSFPVSQAVDGTFEYLVRQKNPLTSIESSNTTLSWTLDRVAPSVVVITQPSSNPYASGDTTFALQGTCEVGATVTLSGAQAGSVLCGAGTFRFDLTANLNGTYDYGLRQSDRTGNLSASVAFQWQRDTSKPPTPVLSSPSPNPYTSNGSQITLAGSCAGTNTVNVTGGATLSATCASGAFSFVIAKSNDGTYNFSVTQTSSVNGQVSSAATVTWTRDTVAPSAPTLTAIAPTSPGSNPNPKLTGTAGVGTTTIQVYRTSSCSGAVATTGTVAAFTGAGIAVPALLQQTMSVSAKAVDLAGNPSGCSATSLAYEHRAAERVMDINQVGNGPSSPTAFAQVGSKVFFRATNGVVGNELFVSDGTAQGTTMVKDINPADSSNPTSTVAFNGMAFFAADDGETGMELWKSDGTEAGTVRVADIFDGPFGSTPANFLAVGSTLYFTADDGENGVELWKTDGTTAGTVLVKDVEPGFVGSTPTQLRAVGGVIVFRATTTAEGIELWRSNGTAAGTTVFDINTGSTSGVANSGSPNYLVNFGSYVYFSATEAATGNELWKTDGTTTTRVTDLYAGTTSSSPTSLAVAGSTLFFSARTSSPTNVGYELFKYTEGGSPTLVKDIYVAGSTASTPALITAISSTKVVFRALTAASGQEPWVSDGTDAGTFQLAEIGTGTAYSAMTQPVAIGGRAYFAGTTDGEVELWATDGTVAGTVRYDANPGSNGSSPSSLTVFGSKIIGSIHTIATGREPFFIDANGPQLMADLNTLPSSSPASFALYNNVLYFAADDGVYGRELWRSDGTTNGTWMVKDINTEAGAHSSPTALVVAGSYLYFRAEDGQNGFELWRTDGTANGTVMVTDINPGDGASTPNYLVALGNQLLFTADDGTNGIELWTATGTGAATMLKDIYAGATAGTPVLLTVMGTKAYFRATTQAAGAELWVTDGTAAGTVLLKDVRAGTSSSSPSNLTVVGGNRLYFTATNGTSGSELFVSDGTTAGTVLVQDLYAGTTGSSPTNLRDVNGVCVFSATTATTGRELWKSSGVAGDITLIKDIRAGVASSSPGAGLLVNGRLYFSAADDTAGNELWATDGTTNGTVRVLDGRAGLPGSNPSSYVAIDATTMLFFANDGVNGTEPWRSNLTANGTYQIQDINVYGPSYGGAYILLGSRILFAANDGVTGTELWRY